MFDPQAPSSPSKPQPKKLTAKVVFKRIIRLILILLIITILVGVGLFINDWVRKSSQLNELSLAHEQLKSESANASREEAKRIVSKVRKHIIIDSEVEPTVATIVDVETLKRRNPFYDKAKNGDQLIVTPERAILYDMDRDIILDVIPVQIKPLEEE